MWCWGGDSEFGLYMGGDWAKNVKSLSGGVINKYARVEQMSR
jgi:hypothetical protein